MLQSAEVMKRAVAQLEKYLDKIEGYTKGTVVLATVFGDVHDIGKSLVNTILTNNGYTVVDLGKQVPIQTIIDAAVEHEATAIGLSALLVSTSKQMPACVQELHAQGLEFPVLIGGAAINRNFGLRILYPNGTESDEVYEPGVFYCKDAFEGLAKMDQLVDGEAREALIAKTRDAAKQLREQPEVTDDDAPPVTDASVRSAAADRQPDPEPAVLGRARARRRHGRGLPPPRHARAVQAPLGRARRQGRGVAAARGRGLQASPRAHVARADLPAPARAARLLPVQLGRQRADRVGSRGPRRARARAPRVPAPAARTTASAWPTSTGPSGRGEVDVVALQAVTAGDEVTELMARLEADGEFAEQLFVHGLGVQTAEGMAEWLHARVRADLGIEPAQGRRYSWGYPACPEQSEHEKVFRLLDAPSIGLRLSGGYAVEPEQSTLAIVAHHPQAVYFGMKSGFLPKTDRQAADELIAGTDKDPTRLDELTDAEPELVDEGAGTASRRWPRPDQAACPDRVLGAACAARARARRQLDRRGVHRPQPDLAPGHALLEQRRHAHQDRGRHLDRLQDHAVGHAVAEARRASRCGARRRRRPGTRRGSPAWPAAPR